MLLRSTDNQKSNRKKQTKLLGAPETVLSITVLVTFMLASSAAIFAYIHSSNAISTAKEIEKSEQLLGGFQLSLGLMKNMIFQSETYINRGFVGAKSQYLSNRDSLSRSVQFVTSAGDEEGWRRWHFTYLEQLTQKFQNTLDAAIKKRESGNVNGAIDLHHRAQQLLDVIKGRLIISDVEEREQLQNLLSDFTRHTQMTSVTFLILAVFSILFVIPLTFLVQRFVATTRKTLLVEQEVSREIIKNAPIGIVQLTPEFKIIDVNVEFEKIVAGSDFKVETSIWDLLPDLPKKNISESINSLKPTILNAVPIKLGDDNDSLERSCDIAIWPIVENDRVRSLIMMIEDITEATTLANQQSVLQQTIAHDLKSPLIAANYLIEAAQGKFDQREIEGQKLLRRLKDSNENALAMVKNMLEISKYRQTVFIRREKKVSLNDLVKDCANELRSRSELADISIIIQQKAEPIEMTTDETALRHLTHNLVDNAIKFSRAGGSVKIVLDKTEEAAIISVNNTGPGIDEKDKEFIFRPYFQSDAGKRSPGGTGIGLYLCRQITSALEGRIEFTSTTLGGTTFTVNLPLNKTKSSQ